GKMKTESVRGRTVIAGDVLVKFRRPLKSTEHAQLSYQMDAETSRDLGKSGLRHIHSKGYNTETLLNFLKTHPDVEYAEPNYVLEAASMPNDPNFNQLWAMFNPWYPGADIGASTAWNKTTGSSSVVV